MTTKVTIMNHGPGKIIARAVSTGASGLVSQTIPLDPGQFADMLYVYNEQQILIDEVPYARQERV